MAKCQEFTKQRHEGRGNRTAARDYNRAQPRFGESSRVGEKAWEAERDLAKDSIRRELEHAETVGRSHAVGGVPEVRRSYKED